MMRSILTSLVILITSFTSLQANEKKQETPPPYPPGWMPINFFEADEKWDDDLPRFREEAVHTYIPNKDKPVDGVFVCLVFHSADPRDFADAWNFALVTIPFPFTYDLGDLDHRNQKRAATHKPQGMQLLLRYLDDVGKELDRPELSHVPIVGWMGQAGPRYLRSLYDVAPHRVLAWADGFPGVMRNKDHGDLIFKVPFAYGWEPKGKNQIRKTGVRPPNRKDTPKPGELSSNVTTYNFRHGIYSKFHFFMSFIDRCIKLRMPDEMPPPGQPVPLKPVVREEGWIGDFMPVSEWNPIAPAKSEEVANYGHQSWLPDRYAAYMWRAFHSARPNPDRTYLYADSVIIESPVIPYSRTRENRKFSGAGYRTFIGDHLYSETPFDFKIDVNVEATKVIYYDGDQVIGEVTEAPWNLKNVTLKPGIRAVFAVAVKPDGTKVTSRCTFPFVKPGKAPTETK